jgi:hypothetical protein
MSERMTLDQEFRQACHDLGYPGSHEDALTALVQLVEFMKDRVASGDITLEQSKAICRASSNSSPCRRSEVVRVPVTTPPRRPASRRGTGPPRSRR